MWTLSSTLLCTGGGALSWATRPPIDRGTHGPQGLLILGPEPLYSDPHAHGGSPRMLARLVCRSQRAAVAGAPQRRGLQWRKAEGVL